MGSKSLNKLEDFITEVRPELFAKLNEYVAIDNFGGNNRTKAFRLRKNGEDTNIFQRINQGNVPQNGPNSQGNFNFNNNRELNINHNNDNVIHINIQNRNNEIESSNINNNIDFD
jgi:hypothetical protein